VQCDVELSEVIEKFSHQEEEYFTCVTAQRTGKDLDEYVTVLERFSLDHFNQTAIFLGIPEGCVFAAVQFPDELFNEVYIREDLGWRLGRRDI
jgi:hypothetical protein